MLVLSCSISASFLTASESFLPNGWWCAKFDCNILQRWCTFVLFPNEQRCCSVDKTTEMFALITACYGLLLKQTFQSTARIQDIRKLMLCSSACCSASPTPELAVSLKLERGLTIINQAEQPIHLKQPVPVTSFQDVTAQNVIKCCSVTCARPLTSFRPVFPHAHNSPSYHIDLLNRNCWDSRVLIALIYPSHLNFTCFVCVTLPLSTPVCSNRSLFRSLFPLWPLFKHMSSYGFLSYTAREHWRSGHGREQPWHHHD